MSLAILVATLPEIPVATRRAIVHVSASAPTGGDGTEHKPFRTIRAAIAAAQSGDTIHVAEGRYAENVVLGDYNSGSSKTLSFLGGWKRGDFASRDAHVYRTVIDGGYNAPCVRLHVRSGTFVFDGFTLIHGKGLGTSWSDGYGHGGGMYLQYWGNDTVTISHNEAASNRTNSVGMADQRGGGMYSHNFGEGVVRYEGNVIRNNLAGKGAGLSVQGGRHVIVHNQIASNIAHSDHGGGIYVSAEPTHIAENAIASNEVGRTAGYGWGGGILIDGVRATMEANTITDNFSPSMGSGVFWDEGAVGSMTHDRIHNNRCPNDSRSGAGVYIDGGVAPSAVLLESVTIANHHCGDDTARGFAVFVSQNSVAIVKNCTLHDNSREFGTDDGGTIAFEFD